MVAGLFIVMAPMPGHADDDRDIRHGHADDDKDRRRDDDKEIRAEIGALKAQVADLQNQVNSLQTSNSTLQSQLAAVQSNPALALGPFVSVDPNPAAGVVGPHITFTGANIHIVSGSGSTTDNGAPTGLGNLIVGYDEPPGSPEGGPPLNSGDRGGSHNLVIGTFNRFTQAAFGGLVAGDQNTIKSFGASVTGGAGNTASGQFATVSGGLGNTASGGFASVSGGQDNTASGDFASVSGGQLNIASGANTVVIGGQNVTDNKKNSIAPQPPFP